MIHLYDYVTGDVLCPPKFINSEATTSSPSVSIPNPAYKVWYQQDKLILGAIVSTLTEAILPKLEHPCQIGFRGYIVLDCKGLILFKTTRHRRHDFESLILWNPAIRTSITLPPPCIDAPSCAKFCVYGFGFDHTINDYKVLRMMLGEFEFFFHLKHNFINSAQALGRLLGVSTIFSMLQMIIHKL